MSNGQGQAPATPKGRSVDCDVCIAQVGEPCYIQTPAEEHKRTGWIYHHPRDLVTGKEIFHVGVRLSASADADRPSQGTTYKSKGS